MPFPKALAKEIGRKRGWKCEKCGREWKHGWLLEVHHVLPKSLGGTDNEDNAMILCLGCHYNAHKDIERSGRTSADLIKSRLTKTNGRWF